MMIDLVQLDTPDTQPVTLAELKLHVRVDHDAEDAALQGQLDAATQIIEDRIGRTLTTATWRATYSGFPRDGRPVVLPMAIASVASVTHGGELLENTAYTVDSRSNPARLLAAGSEGWPATSGQVRVEFTEAIPRMAKQAILLLAGHLYRDRDGQGWPEAVERLIQQLVGVMIG